MTCIDQTVPPTHFTHKTASAIILLTFLIGSASILGNDGISLEGPRRISLPEISVSENPHRVYSGNLTLDLSNKEELNGWMLTGEVAENALVGSYTEERIPAILTFKSVHWIKGGNGSAAGIRILQDGSKVEADPGFGIGKYKIEYEVRYEVPAFPAADAYRGVSTFIVQ